MSARKRFLFLTFIMVGACAMVMAVMTAMLYRHNFGDHRERLQTAVQSQARLIEAIARHDSVYEQNTPGGAMEATLSQIVDAHEHFEGFGETGEFALARREGDFIVSILRHRHGVLEHRPPVAFDSERAEPMRRALKGLSGTVIGLDYRGETVLAAHEPVAVLNLGIVAKIDLAEIRAPFIRSVLSAAAVALLVVLAGTALFFRIGNPIIARLEAYTRDLEKEAEERKRAEESLQRQQAEQQIILNSVPAMIFYKDKDNRFIRVNRALAESTGMTIEEMEGESLFQLYPDLAEDYWRDDMEVMSTGRAKRHIIEPLETPTGKMWVETDKIPYRDNDGKIIGIIGFALDITERRQAEAARARLNAELEAKNEELEQIIYAASHDLRSPLVNIDGYGKELEIAMEELRSALGRDKQPTEAVEVAAQLLAHDIPEALRFIRTSTSKMDALLAGLLIVSRSGRAALTIESLDMNELMANVVEASKFQIKEAGAEINIGELPSCHGDAVQVNQVFSNLIGNALQYLDLERPGAIRISGRVEGERSVYCVEDNGIGIAPAHRQNIFEIFHRLDPAKSKGEGLGLTIVQQILGRLSGYIWVESKLGEGSRFYVALPSVQRNQ